MAGSTGPLPCASLCCVCCCGSVSHARRDPRAEGVARGRHEQLWWGTDRVEFSKIRGSSPTHLGSFSDADCPRCRRPPANAGAADDASPGARGSELAGGRAGARPPAPRPRAAAAPLRLAAAAARGRHGARGPLGARLRGGGGDGRAHGGQAVGRRPARRPLRARRRRLLRRALRPMGRGGRRAALRLRSGGLHGGGGARGVAAGDGRARSRGRGRRKSQLQQQRPRLRLGRPRRLLRLPHAAPPPRHPGAVRLLLRVGSHLGGVRAARARGPRPCSLFPPPCPCPPLSLPLSPSSLSNPSPCTPARPRGSSTRW